MSQILAQLNTRPKGGLPSDILANLKNDRVKCMAILTRSGKVMGGHFPNDDKTSSSKGKDVTVNNDGLSKELNNEASNEVDDARMLSPVTLESQIWGLLIIRYLQSWCLKVIRRFLND